MSGNGTIEKIDVQLLKKLKTSYCEEQPFANAINSYNRIHSFKEDCGNPLGPDFKELKGFA